LIYRYLSISFLLLITHWSLKLPAQVPPGYYSSASGLTGDALKTALHNIIDDHTGFSYDDCTDILRAIDEDSLNSNNVICFYTGWSYGKADFGNDQYQWNREHIWSRSHGDLGFSIPEGTDLFNLRPCDASVNSAKGNRDFDKGVTEYIDGSGPSGCYMDDYIWEPQDVFKGDVARSIFYMAVRYEGDNGELNLEMVDYVNSAPNNEPYYGNMDTLMKWHQEDPVDSYEQRRNDSIYYNYQGNRNPFIDHPEYAGLIWDPEPAFHVTDFSAQNIVLKWAEPMGGAVPDGYLVRYNSTGFGSISDPVDGTPVNDDNNNMNLDFGTDSVMVKGVSPGTYYFKIFPYKGSGESINYKTDGDVQQATVVVQ
jgi:endonuclease I